MYKGSTKVEIRLFNNYLKDDLSESEGTPCGHRLYMQVVSVVLFTCIYKLCIIIMVYTLYTKSYCIHVLMRDEKEERKKQARSNKQTKQSNTCTFMLMRYADGRKKEVSKV